MQNKRVTPSFSKLLIACNIQALYLWYAIEAAIITIGCCHNIWQASYATRDLSYQIQTVTDRAASTCFSDNMREQIMLADIIVSGALRHFKRSKQSIFSAGVLNCFALLIGTAVTIGYHYSGVKTALTHRKRDWYTQEALEDAHISNAQAAGQLSRLAEQFKQLPSHEQEDVYDQSNAADMGRFVGAIIARVNLVSASC
jgi:hypothetical protein